MKNNKNIKEYIDFLKKADTNLRKLNKYFEYNKDKFYWDFNYLINNHKETSKTNTNEGWENYFNNDISNDTKSIFCGYNELVLKTKIVGLYNSKSMWIKELKENTAGYIVLEKTPFYPTGGGQLCDIGIITINSLPISINEVIKNNNIIYHYTNDSRSTIKINDAVLCEVDKENRIGSEANHSATHLLNSFIKRKYDPNAIQNGSFINNKYFTFDFISNNLAGQIPCKNNDTDWIRLEIIARECNIEINKILNLNIEPSIRIKSFSEIRDKKEIIKNFLEKYENNVRIIKFDKYSEELCSGCHVKNTCEIEVFYIYRIYKKGHNHYRIRAITKWKNVFEYFSNIANTYRMRLKRLEKENEESHIRQLKSIEFISTLDSFKKYFVEWLRTDGDATLIRFDNELSKQEEKNRKDLFQEQRTSNLKLLENDLYCTWTCKNQKILFFYIPKFYEISWDLIIQFNSYIQKNSVSNVNIFLFKKNEQYFTLIYVNKKYVSAELYDLIFDSLDKNNTKKKWVNKNFIQAIMYDEKDWTNKLKKNLLSSNYIIWKKEKH